MVKTVHKCEKITIFLNFSFESKILKTTCLYWLIFCKLVELYKRIGLHMLTWHCCIFVVHWRKLSFLKTCCMLVHIFFIKVKQDFFDTATVLLFFSFLITELCLHAATTKTDTHLKLFEFYLFELSTEANPVINYYVTYMDVRQWQLFITCSMSN